MDAIKDFIREDLLLSLCGLNCGLCSMHLSGHCPGCGGGDGNQSCKIAKCSMQHGKIEYCSRCGEFPCEKYEGVDEFDSFITHHNRRKDFEKLEKIGTAAYQAEQKEKINILEFLLKEYDDGRKKTFYCLAVNLLDLSDLRMILKQIKTDNEIYGLPLKEKAACAAGLFQKAANEHQITLKLRKKLKKDVKNQ